MYQKKTNETTPLDGNPQFVPIVKWYEVVQDLEMRLNDYMAEHNIDGIMTAYYLYFSKWYPYIEKLLDENTKKFLSLDDIYKLKGKLRGGQTNFDMKNDDNIYNQIEQMIMEKWGKLKLLIAQTKLEVPLFKQEWRPAALEGDGW